MRIFKEIGEGCNKNKNIYNGVQCFPKAMEREESDVFAPIIVLIQLHMVVMATILWYNIQAVFRRRILQKYHINLFFKLIIQTLNRKYIIT